MHLTLAIADNEMRPEHLTNGETIEHAQAIVLVQREMEF